MPSLANATVSSDFESYRIQRVGLLPFVGEEITSERSITLQRAFHAELSQSTPFEVVQLGGADLEALEESEPYRRGWYRPRTIIELTQRYSLDAIVFGTVTQERFFAPQLLALQVDLVAAETGLVIWSGSVQIDANDPRVVEGLQLYYGSEEDGEAWRLALLSPERLGRFAAFQVACLL
jgi:hypothetical protein